MYNIQVQCNVHRIKCAIFVEKNDVVFLYFFYLLYLSADIIITAVSVDILYENIIK